MSADIIALCVFLIWYVFFGILHAILYYRDPILWPPLPRVNFKAPGGYKNITVGGLLLCLLTGFLEVPLILIIKICGVEIKKKGKK